MTTNVQRNKFGTFEKMTIEISDVSEWTTISMALMAQREQDTDSMNQLIDFMNNGLNFDAKPTIEALEKHILLLNKMLKSLDSN